MKRYCQTLQLVDDDEMISKYVEVFDNIVSFVFFTF